mmetsp:Transcript_30485/g.40557  ORF Transcript_30485/g.40557 Transcript_30485/m.40557 type:complete len:88 (+) Transcript_30485:313-576(+)
MAAHIASFDIDGELLYPEARLCRQSFQTTGHLDRRRRFLARRRVHRLPLAFLELGKTLQVLGFAVHHELLALVEAVRLHRVSVQDSR